MRNRGEMMIEICCHKVAAGCATGEALATTHPISFLGDVDAETGMVVDQNHELHGKCISGKILIFPEGKGSTVGSYVIYQLRKRGKAPAGMINVRSEPIIAVGAIMSEIPLVDEVPSGLLKLKEGTKITVDADNLLVRIFQSD